MRPWNFFFPNVVCTACKTAERPALWLFTFLHLCGLTLSHPSSLLVFAFFDVRAIAARSTDTGLVSKEHVIILLYDKTTFAKGDCNYVVVFFSVDSRQGNYW